MDYLGDHQKTRSPLLDAGILCVKQFPLDYMNLVCLGVVKRILKYFKSGPRCCKLSMQQINQISKRLNSLNGCMPSEFVRQPRSLDELDRWKATASFCYILGRLSLNQLYLVKHMYTFSHFL